MKGKLFLKRMITDDVIYKMMLSTITSAETNHNKVLQVIAKTEFKGSHTLCLIEDNRLL